MSGAATESTAPEAIAQHDLIAVALSVGLDERAPVSHPDAEQVEVIPRHSRALQSFGLPETRHVDGDGRQRCRAGKASF